LAVLNGSTGVAVKGKKMGFRHDVRNVQELFGIVRLLKRVLVSVFVMFV